jgi:two-component system phosphate regulon response regulator PhoB
VIVDRDVATVEPLRMSLADAGFVVRVITDKTAAVAAILERPPQLVIIDWDLPRAGGPELISAVRSASPRAAPRAGGIGLIILSALSGEQHVIDGLNQGADDYVAKPYSSRELVARSQAVLRLRLRNSQGAMLTCGDLVLNLDTTSAMAFSRSLDLSPMEYRLLAFLMKNPGRAFNRSQLLAAVWGVGSDVDERTVDVNVQRLRKLLTQPGCDAYIRTVRGFGYRLDVPPLPRTI